MSEESQGIDPYDVVLKDLYAQQERISAAIASIEALRGGRSSSSAGPANGGRPEPQSSSMDGPGALLGMSIVDAAKKLLAAKRQPLRNPEFAALFKAGGLVLNSREPANTIGSVLTRRFAEAGDIVRVDRGTWGLKEWYPGRSFKAKDTDKGESEAPATPPKEHWTVRRKREREAAQGKIIIEPNAP